MQCDEIRERFPQCDTPPEHVRTCAECAREWELHTKLRTLKAPLLPDSFTTNVLTALQERGFFETPEPTLAEKLWAHFARLLLPLALAACALLFLWMGSLATRHPSPELRALEPDKARMWSSLPDAVPPPAIPGPAPSQEQVRLVKRGELE